MRILMILASSSALCGLGLTPGTSLSPRWIAWGPFPAGPDFPFGLDPAWTQNSEPDPRPGLGLLTDSARRQPLATGTVSTRSPLFIDHALSARSPPRSFT